MTDAELINAGTAEAFREVYDRHAYGIFGFHQRRTGSGDAAHDLTAETFAQAWLSRARFRDEADGSAGPWLVGIARNVLASSVRRQALERSACERLGLLELVDRQAVDVTPDETWLSAELDEALAQLSPAQREAIELHVVDGLPFDAVATATRTTPTAARVRAHRGLASLRQQLLRPGKDTR